MSKCPEAEAGRAIICNVVEWQGEGPTRDDAPGLKPDFPVSCPTGCSSPLDFQTRAQRPATFLPNTQTTRLGLSSFTCCLPALLYANSPPFSLSAAPFLLQATHSLASHSSSRPKDHLLYGSISCSTTSVQPKDFICHKDSDTREPPLLSATRIRAISLLLDCFPE